MAALSTTEALLNGTLTMGCGYRRGEQEPCLGRGFMVTSCLQGVMVPCLPGQGESSQCLMCKIFSSLDLVNASSQILSYLEISSWKRGWIHMANRAQHTHVTQAYCTLAFSPSALLHTQRPTHCIYLELSVSNKQPL